MSRYNLPFSPGSSQGAGMRNFSENDRWNGQSFLERYFTELLAERQKFGPFMQVLPNCSRLLNQEIMRISSLLGTSSSFSNHEPMEHGSPLTSGGLLSNGSGGLDMSAWSSFPFERVGNQASGLGWRGVPASPTPPVLKKIIRIDVAVDRYPNFNFVGRLLGPRGNSLKRVESMSGCRVYIRGRGSVKDMQEENMRDKPGYEHLNEPLHVLVEAELPANIIDARLKQAKDIIDELLKPVDESQDIYKKDQLRELALLNGTLREESPFSPGSASPFNNPGMKRAKTGR